MRNRLGTLIIFAMIVAAMGAVQPSVAYSANAGSSELTSGEVGFELRKVVYEGPLGETDGGGYGGPVSGPGSGPEKP